MEKVTILPDRQNIIKQIPLFLHLDDAEQKLISEKGEFLMYQKDEIIYDEDKLPDALYCIVSGRVKAFTKDSSGKEVVIEYLYRGTYFGVISLLTGNKHSVTTQVLNDSLILRINKDDFEDILKRIPHLALWLSQNLLRRVKRKDIHEKRVFESSIISVFNVSEEGLESAIYSLNLAASLKKETNKNILLIDIFINQSKIKQLCKIHTENSNLEIRDIVPEESKIKGQIKKLEFGIDFLNIATKDSFNVKSLIGLLSFLVNDYHFVVVNTDVRHQAVYDFLTQSDSIHLMIGATTGDLEKASLSMDKLKKHFGQIEDKIKIILSESRSSDALDSETRSRIFNYKIYATLRISREIYFEEQPLALRMPEIEYSRALRRIVRDIAGLRIGLVLGSGAALGLTQIGVIKVLEQEDIPIDVICGSSIGAFFGGLWAIGKTGKEIEEITINYKKFQSMFNMSDFAFPLRGIIKGRRLLNYFVNTFEKKTFFDVKRTLKVVACDVATMREVVIEEGEIAKAIMASVSIPALFEPVQIGQRYFIDGGVLNPLPCDVLLRMGIKKIIAVNVLPRSEDIARTYEESQKQQLRLGNFKPNIFSIIVSTMQSMEYKIALMSGETQADIVLHPDVSNIKWYEFYSAQDLIKRGEEEASRNIGKIKDLLES